MEFCKQCENMYFIRVDEKSKLEYHCKQCGYAEEYYNDINDCCIYTHQLEKNHSVHEISINKYITKDPTLPRLTNLKCVNKSCLTNKYIPNSVLVYGIYDNTEEEFIPEEFITFITTSIIQDDSLKVQFTKLDDKMGILTFESNLILKKYINDIKNVEYKNREITCSELLDIKPEIIFIKYDSVNMKFLYICSTCNTSWKNN